MTNHIKNPTQYSDQEILNESFNDSYKILTVAAYAYDGSTNTFVPQTGTSPAYAVRLDDYTTANVTYVGKAATGTATSAATWQIKKMDETTGLVITWADGNANFDNVWDNRATTQTYS